MTSDCFGIVTIPRPDTCILLVEDFPTSSSSLGMVQVQVYWSPLVKQDKNICCFVVVVVVVEIFSVIRNVSGLLVNVSFNILHSH